MLMTPAKLEPTEIGRLETSARWVRQQILQMISGAGKGHIGGSLSCTDILVYLFCSGHFKLDPINPKAGERDRIIFSKGHSAEAYYGVLAKAGFIPEQILATYGQNGSPLGGHIDRSLPGVEYSAGSLGHGLGVACGFALAARHSQQSFLSIPILGDGECYEGSIWEAAMVAAHHNLSNIIAIVDRNGEITLDKTEKCNRLEPFADKWRAFGWEVREADGHSYQELHSVLHDVHSRQSDKPLIILANTVKGRGVSFMEKQVGWHHKVPKGAELAQAQRELGISTAVHSQGSAPAVSSWSAIGDERRPGMAEAGADVAAAQGCAARIERKELTAGALLSQATATDIRDALFDQLVAAADRDPRIFVISCDQGALGFSQLREKYPDRCFNLGISEQTAIDLAAGLALEGMHPCVYAITNFISSRCFEQISVNLGAMNLPVVLIASGAGLTYSSDGPTHHSLQDIALMRTIPYMRIFNPCDGISTAATMQLAMSFESPAYIRLEKGNWPGFDLSSEEVARGFRKVRKGSKLAIVSTGVMTHAAVKLCDKLRQENLDPALIDVFRVKPFSVPEFCAACSDFQALVVLEENVPCGSLTDIVCNAMCSTGAGLPVLQCSMPDVPCYHYGTREWIHSRYGLDALALSEKILTWFKELR